jgi:membrane protein required for beta-lactamase induction
VVSVFISANRRNVLSAKRMGLTVVGIQGILDGVSFDCFSLLLFLVVNSLIFDAVHYDNGRGEGAGSTLRFLYRTYC